MQLPGGVRTLSKSSGSTESRRMPREDADSPPGEDGRGEGPQGHLVRYVREATTAFPNGKGNEREGVQELKEADSPGHDS